MVLARLPTNIATSTATRQPAMKRAGADPASSVLIAVRELAGTNEAETVVVVDVASMVLQ